VEQLDLNTRLQNYAITCDRMAAGHRAAAAEARARPSTGWPEQDRADAAEARTHDAEARKWDARGEHAKRGLLLVHDHDLKFLMDPAHAALIADAESQRRAVHVQED
jgi:hypothetical protein